jgi:hypothetical protein
MQTPTKTILAALALSAMLGQSAAAQARVELGILDCHVAGGAGFIIGSTKDLSCTFSPAGRPPETYFGVVRKFGLDVGVTGASLIRWVVLAPTVDAYAPGALAGNYVGVSAEATAGVGLGANALVGGSGETFALQPVSVQAQEGLNLAIGFSSFQLRTTRD